MRKIDGRIYLKDVKDRALGRQLMRAATQLPGWEDVRGVEV